MSRLRVACVAAVLIGVVAGLVFALLQRKPAARAVPVAGDLFNGTPQRPDLPLGTPRHIQLSSGTADPSGGPPWVLRSFTTRLRHDRLNRGVWSCAQVGRLVSGRFGWIAPGRPFRVAGFTDSDAPTQCDSSRQLQHGYALIGSFVLLTGARASQSAPAATVTWGQLGHPLASATYSNGVHLVPSTAQAVLDVRAGEVPTWMTGVAVYRDGHRRRLHNLNARTGHFSLDGATIAARAPDPAGGPPWAVIHPRTARKDCLVGPARLVGSHIGVIDAYFGIFWADQQLVRHPGPATVSLRNDIVAIRSCWQASIPRPHRRPAAVSVLVSYRHDEDPVSRVQLRQPDGRTIILAATKPDVASLSVNGQSLVPGKSHVALMVEPGTSPGAEFSVKAHLRDGSNLFWPLDVATG